MRRFVVLAFLYMAQGLPFGFFAQAVPVLLNRSQPAKIVGLSSLLAAPWALKFLFGPIVDATPSRRRTIVPVNLACILSLFLLGLARPSEQNLTPLLAGFFLVSLFSAVQDVATDGLALDMLEPEERGRAGGIQVGAQRLGMMAGGGGVLAIIDWLGYREAFWLMAVAILGFTIPVFTIREGEAGARTVPAGPKPGMHLLRTFFDRADAWRIVALIFGLKVGDAFAAGMVNRWFVQQGLTNAEIALTRGLVGGVAAIAGALGGGLLFRVAGRKSALVVGGALQTVAIAMYLLLDVVHPVGTGPMARSVYAAASVVEHVFGGAATAVLLARMMDLCRDEARATDYTVQACILIVVTGIGLFGSGFVADLIGLRGLFAVATVLGLLAPLAVLRYWTPDVQRRAA